MIGAGKKQNGYLEGNHYLVSWCVGHLVELASADAYTAQYQKWRREDLPILPNPWQYVVSEGTKQQFTILKRLMNAPEVKCIVCATDAGREGELIFRLVVEQCGCQKPVQRLWISSMEETAIAEGFRTLKPDAAYDNLYHAALCRAQADWLVGINATRLFSTMYHQKLNIGRVMTPTLAMIVEREAQIAAFQSEPFYHIRMDCGGVVATSERMTSRADAERIAALCNRKAARVVALDTKEQTEKPPKLYDLTALQRDANRLLGYTAQQTLDYCQALYEKKLATYPRTDSRYLTEHMEESAQALVQKVRGELPFGECISMPCRVKQVIDNGKVSDHHAILPTVNANSDSLAMLPVGESSILTLLMTRLLCAVANPSLSLETTVTLECEGFSFSAKGRQITDEGWEALDHAYRATLKSREAHPDAEQAAQLPPLNKDMEFLPVATSVTEGKTTPPKSFTEGTLLSAMESAGAEEAPDDAERKGLGTPATRAGVIEKLVKVGLMERKKGKASATLLPTSKGVALITVVPEEIQSPLLTAEWEQQLKQIERGEQSPETFMAGIADMVQALVDTAQPVQEGGVLFTDERTTVGVCPRCGNAVVENQKGFVCRNRDCRFALWKENRFFTSKHKQLTASVAAALLKEGHVFMKGLYSEKTGKPYDATIMLDDTGGQYVNYRLAFPEKEKV